MTMTMTMATRLSRPLLRTHRQFTSPSHSSTLQLPQALSLRHNHTQHTHTPPIFSSNVRDHSKALTSLSPLLKSPDLDQSSAPSAATTAVAEGGKWTLIPSRMGVERTYKFKTFKQAWGFMSVVAEKCEVEKHHPEWFNCYNEVKITWTTHRPRGLSEKDILMARFCDEKAGEFGEVDSK